jgi:hypothetical protein
MLLSRDPRSMHCRDVWPRPNSGLRQDNQIATNVVLQRGQPRARMQPSCRSTMHARLAVNVPCVHEASGAGQRPAQEVSAPLTFCTLHHPRGKRRAAPRCVKCTVSCWTHVHGSPIDLGPFAPRLHLPWLPQLRTQPCSRWGTGPPGVHSPCTASARRVQALSNCRHHVASGGVGQRHAASHQVGARPAAGRVSAEQSQHCLDPSRREHELFRRWREGATLRSGDQRTLLNGRVGTGWKAQYVRVNPTRC